MTRDSIRSYATFLLKAPLVYQNWWDMLLSGHCEPPGVVLRLRNGLEFRIRPRTTDRTTLNEMLMFRPYETDPRFCVSEADVVVDIGAHIGTFAILAAAQATQGKVYAVEPVPGNFEVLCENVRFNQAANVVTICAAIGPCSGTGRIYGDGAAANLFGKRGGPGREVRLITLSQLMEEQHLDRIDLLKMDCEGAEHETLAKATPPVLRRIRRIVLECHNMDGRNNIDTLQNSLRDKGFTVSASPVDARGHSLLFALNNTAVS
jgi:FkbM family methyltransferase